jgi:hypothetical protein
MYTHRITEMIQSIIRLEKYVASMEVERHTYEVLVRQTKRKKNYLESQGVHERISLQ